MEITKYVCLTEAGQVPFDVICESIERPGWSAAATTQEPRDLSLQDMELWYLRQRPASEQRYGKEFIYYNMSSQINDCTRV